jgi:hypothetical protein
MGRTGLFLALALLLVAACSSGGGSAAGTTTTSVTSTTLATTTTTSPEDAVKTAYLAYWKMVDRVSALPDAGDPELGERATDPLLSDLRSDLGTQKLQGTSTQPPVDADKNKHTIGSLSVSADSASFEDCFVDGRIEKHADGTSNDSVVTKRLSVKARLDGGVWKISEVRVAERSQGISGCANS